MKEGEIVKLVLSSGVAVLVKKIMFSFMIFCWWFIGSLRREIYLQC